MSIEAVKKFYNLTLINTSLQNTLIKTENTAEFINESVRLGKQYECIFSEKEMKSTIASIKNSTVFDDVDFGSKWINKIMAIGWVPFGYTR